MIQNDPIDDMANRALAKYALAVQAMTAAAIAIGLPEGEVRETIAREKAKFIAELAAGVIELRQALDDPDAARH